MRPNHVLHFILSLLTGGLWLPVWLGITVLAGNPHTGQPYSGIVTFVKWWLIVIAALIPFGFALAVYETTVK